MKLIVVSIRDRALAAYGQPVFVHTVGQAIRSFQDEINNTQSEISKHPDDYDLYQLGTYDNNTGQFLNWENAPTQIAIGKQLKTNGA